MCCCAYSILQDDQLPICDKCREDDKRAGSNIAPRPAIRSSSQAQAQNRQKRQNPVGDAAFFGGENGTIKTKTFNAPRLKAGVGSRYPPLDTYAASNPPPEYGPRASALTQLLPGNPHQTQRSQQPREQRREQPQQQVAQQRRRTQRQATHRSDEGTDANPITLADTDDEEEKKQAKAAVERYDRTERERHLRSAATRSVGSLGVDAALVQQLQGLRCRMPPEGGPGSVEFTAADLARLEPDEFLNDTAIDYYLRYVQTKMRPEDAERCYFFNSFFYKKLSEKQAGVQGAALAEKNYPKVKKWTRGVDIFAKDYIFVPIHDHLHWSLLIICHPGKKLSLPPKSNAVKRGGGGGGGGAAGRRSRASQQQSDVAAANAESSFEQLLLNKAVQGTEAEGFAAGAGSGDGTSGDADEVMEIVIDIEPPPSTPADPRENPQPEAFMLHLDSLTSGHSSSAPATTLRTYLEREWHTRLADPSTPDTFVPKQWAAEHPEDAERSFKGMMHKKCLVPSQDNHCDCGLFVCAYVEYFTSALPQALNLPAVTRLTKEYTNDGIDLWDGGVYVDGEAKSYPGFLTKYWFPQRFGSNLRWEMSRLVLTHMAQAAGIWGADAGWTVGNKDTFCTLEQTTALMEAADRLKNTLEQKAMEYKRPAEYRPHAERQKELRAQKRERDRIARETKAASTVVVDDSKESWKKVRRSSRTIVYDTDEEKTERSRPTNYKDSDSDDFVSPKKKDTGSGKRRREAVAAAAAAAAGKGGSSGKRLRSSKERRPPGDTTNNSNFHAALDDCAMKAVGFVQNEEEEIIIDDAMQPTQQQDPSPPLEEIPDQNFEIDLDKNTEATHEEMDLSGDADAESEDIEIVEEGEGDEGTSTAGFVLTRGLNPLKNIFASADACADACAGASAIEEEAAVDEREAMEAPQDEPADASMGVIEDTEDEKEEENALSEEPQAEAAAVCDDAISTEPSSSPSDYMDAQEESIDIGGNNQLPPLDPEFDKSHGPGASSENAQHPNHAPLPLPQTGVVAPLPRRSKKGKEKLAIATAATAAAGDGSGSVGRGSRRAPSAGETPTPPPGASLPLQNGNSDAEVLPQADIIPYIFTDVPAEDEGDVLNTQPQDSAQLPGTEIHIASDGDEDLTEKKGAGEVVDSGEQQQQLRRTPRLKQHIHYDEDGKVITTSPSPLPLMKIQPTSHRQSPKKPKPKMSNQNGAQYQNQYQQQVVVVDSTPPESPRDGKGNTRRSGTSITRQNGNGGDGRSPDSSVHHTGTRSGGNKYRSGTGTGARTEHGKKVALATDAFKTGLINSGKAKEGKGNKDGGKGKKNWNSKKRGRGNGGGGGEHDKKESGQKEIKEYYR